MSISSLNELNSQLDRLSQSLDSIAFIKANENTTFDDKKMQFVAQSFFQSIFTTKTSFDQNDTGLILLATESENILKSVQAIIQNKKVDEDSKQKLVDTKISQIQQKLSHIEFGLEKLRNNYSKDQTQHFKITDSIRNFRESLVRNLNTIQTIMNRKAISLYDRPFPFVASQDLDDLPLNLLESYALDLEQAGRLHGLDSSFMKKANALFYAHKDKLAAKAMKLHEEFKTKYWGDQPPVADDNTATTLCTIFQLKEGIKMLRTNFPGLTACAHGPQQKADISQLLMLIMTGNALEPHTDVCIRLRELHGASSPTHEQVTAENRSNILDHLILLLNIPENVTDQEYLTHLRQNVREGIRCFLKDCIERTGITFAYGDLSKPLGPNTTPIFLHDMNRMYTQFLFDNPTETLKSVKNYRNCDLLTALNKLNLPFKEDSLMSKEVLVELLKEHLNPDNPLFNEIMKATEIPNHLVEVIAACSGCKPNEIESLMRIKVFEVMLMMNQAFSQPITLSMNSTLLFYQNPLNPDLDPQSLYPKATTTKYQYSPDFRSVSVHTIWNVKLRSNNYALEQKVEFLEPAPTIAWVQSIVEFREFISHNKKQETLICDLCFSWKVTDSSLDYLATLVNPAPLEEELRKINDTLHEIQNLSPGTTLVRTKEGLKAIPSPKGLTESSLEIIDREMLRARQTFQIYANANKIQRPEQVKMEGDKLVNNMTNTAVVLKRLSQTNSHHLNRQTAIQQRMVMINETCEQIAQLSS